MLKKKYKNRNEYNKYSEQFSEKHFYYTFSKLIYVFFIFLYCEEVKNM